MNLIKKIAIVCPLSLVPFFAQAECKEPPETDGKIVAQQCSVYAQIKSATKSQRITVTTVGNTKTSGTSSAVSIGNNTMTPGNRANMYIYEYKADPKANPRNNTISFIVNTTGGGLDQGLKLDLYDTYPVDQLDGAEVYWVDNPGTLKLSDYSIYVGWDQANALFSVVVDSTDKRPSVTYKCSNNNNSFSVSVDSGIIKNNGVSYPGYTCTLTPTQKTGYQIR